MSAFTLDTSGAVMVEFAPGCDELITWDRLPPFEQGYVEALFDDGWDWSSKSIPQPKGFSDLAPETLAAIRKDCAAFQQHTSFTGDADSGGLFWTLRQRGEYLPPRPNQWSAFPPLTVTRGDDGKVRLSAVADTTDRSAMPRDEH